MTESSDRLGLGANPKAAPMTAPDAVLFDWDSTLVDNWASITLALNHALVAMGHEPWSEAATRARIGYSARDTFPAVFGEQADEAKEMFYTRFNQVHLEGLKPMPGAEAMLRDLQATGIYMAVVSNKNGRFLRAEAAYLGWQNYFKILVGATDAAHDKPARDPIDMALKSSGIAAGPTVWYVGDTALDMTCAHNANCRSILLREQIPQRKEFDDCIPDSYVTDCIQLFAFFGERWLVDK